jgi:hypothetical protein
MPKFRAALTRCLKLQSVSDYKWWKLQLSFDKSKTKYSVKLPAVLHETSGLVFSDNILWTTNDDTDTTIYGVDTSGLIQKKNSP